MKTILFYFFLIKDKRVIQGNHQGHMTSVCTLGHNISTSESYQILYTRKDDYCDINAAPCYRSHKHFTNRKHMDPPRFALHSLLFRLFKMRQNLKVSILAKCHFSLLTT